MPKASVASLVTIANGQPVTTTLTIAAGTAVDHKNVLELVRTYLNDLQEFGRVAFETQPFETAGGTQNREVAVLNEEQSALVLAYMRNSVIVRQFKKALIRDFFKMRAQLRAPALPNFADPAAAARAWADEVDGRRAAEAAKLQLEHKVAEQAPAVAALDLIASAKGTQCITDAAKVLQMKPHELTDLLLQKKWMYHRPGKPGYIAYQDRLDSGHLKHKLHNYKDPESGEYRAKEQVMVTKKGLTKLASLIAARPASPPSGPQGKLDIE